MGDSLSSLSCLVMGREREKDALVLSFVLLFVRKAEKEKGSKDSIVFSAIVLLDRVNFATEQNAALKKCLPRIFLHKIYCAWPQYRNKFPLIVHAANSRGPD